MNIKVTINPRVGVLNVFLEKHLGLHRDLRRIIILHISRLRALKIILTFMKLGPDLSKIYFRQKWTFLGQITLRRKCN